MRAQHSTSTTLTVSLIACVALLGALVLGADKLASSAPLTLVGGLLSSLLFFFLLTAVGSIEANAGIKYTRWAEGVAPSTRVCGMGAGLTCHSCVRATHAPVLLCLLVATVFASTVHRVCVTSWCVLVALPLLWCCAMTLLAAGTTQHPVFGWHPVLRQRPFAAHS